MVPFSIILVGEFCVTIYTPSTIKSIVTAMNQWKAFQQSVHKVYDFDDIDMKCYYDYTTFLKKIGRAHV